MSTSPESPDAPLGDAGSEESTSVTDTTATVAEGDTLFSAEPSGDIAPARPRRARRTKAQIAADEAAAAGELEISAAPAESADVEAAPAETVAEPTPERPRRTRRPRAAAAEPVAPTEEPDLLLAAPELITPEEAEPVAESPLEPVGDSVVVSENDPFAVEEEAIFADGLAQDDDATDPFAEDSIDPLQADAEAAAAAGSSRSRRNRRGRGRDRSRPATDAVAETPAAEPAAPSAPRPPAGGGKRTRGAADSARTAPSTEVVRKRGPQTLARTLSLPALPATLLIANSSDIGAASTSSAPIVTERRGTRTVPTLRRILTPDGIAVIPAEAAAALLSSTVALARDPLAGSAAAEIPATLLPLLAPAVVVPEYEPLPAETLARLPEVRVISTNGVPVLHVNGNPVLPAFLFVNTEVVDEAEAAVEIAVSQIRRAYAAGVRLFTLLAHLPWKRRSGERRYDSIDQILSLVAENAPEALVLPRMIFSPPASWERANPEEMSVYARGETGDVSLASQPFWKDEAKSAFRAAIEYLAQGDHAARVLGVYLEHGEWLQPKGIGPDRSTANTNGFRTWLKARYKNSEVGLRASWYDGSVTFETAEIPSDEVFAAASDPSNTQAVFLSDRETRCADFFAYTSDLTAQTITSLAAIAKEASGGRLAVAASYGYTLELGRPACGHYALATVLASPDVDILTAPISYSGRTPGGSAPVAVPVDSILLAGKLFVFEDDTKTHKALRETEDLYNPKITTPEGTRAVHTRNLGAALTKGCGVSWMDLWGEGWLDDEAIWEDLGSLNRLADGIAARRRSGTASVAAPDVAVFVDEASLFDVRGGEEPALLHQLIGHHRDTLLRAGARVGFYLLSDLLKPEFPKTPRLMIFLNAFRIPAEIRAAIQSRFQDDGRTLAWIFAPGARESANIAELADVIGMQLRLQPWGSRTGTQITEGRSPLTESARGQRFGEEKRTNPSYMVVDPKALLLGEYAQSGNPSLAVRKHARWQSVFIGERDLPLPLLRGLYRLAGVPVVTTDDDATHAASDGVVLLHSAMGGDTTVFSIDRSPVAVYDILSGEVIAGKGYGARVPVPARGTRLLLLASPQELTERFGIAEEVFTDAPLGLAESEIPAAAAAFAFEHVAAPPVQAPQSMRLQPVELSVTPEDIALFEAALSGELALAEKEGADSDAGGLLSGDDSATTGRKKRRRRRRRGGAAGDPLGDSTGDEEEDEEGGDPLAADASRSALAPSDDERAGFARADAVFAFAELTSAATTYDADALLPLIHDADPDGANASPTAEEEPVSSPFAASAALIDPVAELMARIFSVPPLAEPAPSPADTTARPARPGDRLPTLFELLPLSEEVTETPGSGNPETGATGDPVPTPLDQESGASPDPWTSGDAGRFTAEFRESTDDADGPIDALAIEGATSAPSPRSPESEEVDALTETPLGLLSAVGRRRRGESTAGGFASRLRRRRSEESADAASETPSSPPGDETGIDNN